MNANSADHEQDATETRELDDEPSFEQKVLARLDRLGAGLERLVTVQASLATSFERLMIHLARRDSTRSSPWATGAMVAAALAGVLAAALI